MVEKIRWGPNWYIAHRLGIIFDINPLLNCHNFGQWQLKNSTPLFSYLQTQGYLNHHLTLFLGQKKKTNDSSPFFT